MLLTKDSKNEVKFLNEWFILKDASPNRLLYHNENGMMIISAMTAPLPVGISFVEMTPEQQAQVKEAVKQTEELKKDIRTEGLGYIPALGGYPYHEDGREEMYDANEFSLIVPRNPKVMDEEEFVDFAIELCKKYNQQAVLLSGISFIENGQARYVRPGDLSKYEIDPDEDFQFNKVKKVNFDPEKNPYYTRFKGSGNTAFVYTKDSQTVIYDDRSMNYLSRYFANHHPHGWAANCAEGQRGEILLYRG